AERLDRWIDEIIDIFAEHPAYARLLLRSLFEDDELAGELPEEQEANDSLRRITGAGARLLKEGMETGVFHPASAGHTLQTLTGAPVYHLAPGDSGNGRIGRPLLPGSGVRRRKAEVRALLHRGLVVARHTA